MRIISIDIGYGDVKCISGTETKIENILKFPSVIGKVEKNEMVNDERLIEYDGSHYYVGSDALPLPTSAIIDIADYQRLEYFAPLFVYKTFEMVEAVPDILVLGLSIAQIKNSGYYKEKIQSYLKAVGLTPEIFVLPQGAIAKLAIDRYGTNFPEDSISFNKNASYILADNGFNTLDVCHVINGKTSSNLVVGLENKGIVLIAQEMVEKIKEIYKIELSISEVKDVLIEGQFKRRGKVYKCDKILEESKSSYLALLREVIEEEFGEVLDKVDNLIMVGGGSALFQKDQDEFLKVPMKYPEYYNAIGFYEYGLTKV